MKVFKLYLLVFVLFVCWKPTCSNLNIHRAIAEDANSQSEYIQQKPILGDTFTKTTFINEPINITSYSRNEAAVYAIISACMVGLTGIVPLFILPSFKDSELNEESKYFATCLLLQSYYMSTSCRFL